ATTPPTSTPRSTIMRPITRSFGASKRAKTGAGATWTSSTWSRRRTRHDARRDVVSIVSVKREPEGRVADVWPRLDLAEWESTRATLHLWTQMIGKTRLALAPPENHWWHAALYLTTRGLTTSPMPVGARTVEVELDFHDHALIARTSDGAVQRLALTPQSVAEFYERYRTALRALGVEPAIWPHPVEMATAIPFGQDRTHASYD